jgi:flavin-binding protein dodecin
MSIARITEISATSAQSFEDAIKQGVERASKTLRGIRSAWIKELNIDVRDGAISDYRVNMLVTFILEE